MAKDLIYKEEADRIRVLSEYNLDYSALQENFADLTRLAAKFAGTDISLINLLDSYQQWTVGQHGIAVDNIPKEESICQYTIQEGIEQFEVKNLKEDERFNQLEYVNNEQQLRYYYGIPIKTETGHSLGALCVMDRTEKNITAEKAELLKLIAKEVVNRLNVFKQTELLQTRIHNLSKARRVLAHDIRGPLTGIIGLAQLGVGEAAAITGNPYIAEYFQLILDSGQAAATMVEDILKSPQYENGEEIYYRQYTLPVLKEKIEDLFMPQVRKKELSFQVTTSKEGTKLNFYRGNILQIACNLVANAIKFTPIGGTVSVMLAVNTLEKPKLTIEVTDNGMGMPAEHIQAVLKGAATSTPDTDGETGFGMGLALVKQLVEQAKGSLKIESAPAEGATFKVVLPLL